jgi:hypothetical protein
LVPFSPDANADVAGFFISFFLDEGFFICFFFDAGFFIETFITFFEGMASQQELNE